MGSVGVPPIHFDHRDFTTPEGAATVNDWFQKVTMAINTLYGLHGDIPIQGTINMNGNTITNLAPPVKPTDAVHLLAATQAFGPDVIQAAMEVTGDQMLQTTRRINDTFQREQFSSFLNDVLNTGPSSNSSSITVTPVGGNTVVTVAAGTYAWGDGQKVAYTQRVDTFVSPVVNNWYYYYLRRSDNTLQFVGPYTVNNSVGQMDAFTDGKGFVGQAKVQAGGGGTGGGGLDPATRGGCTEIGTMLNFPDGADVNIHMEPCKEWCEVEYEGGEIVAFAFGTLIGTFMRVNDSEIWAARKDGLFGRILKITRAERRSWKQVARVSPHGIYWVGRGKWMTHNAKPNIPLP